MRFMISLFMCPARGPHALSFTAEGRLAEVAGSHGSRQMDNLSHRIALAPLPLLFRWL